MLCCVGVFSLLLCKEEGSSPVSAIKERSDMGLYEVFFLGFGMLANSHMCGIMLVLKEQFSTYS